MKKTGNLVPCTNCERLFYLPQWRKLRSKANYCSHECHSKSLVIERAVVSCRQCGRSFLIRPKELRRGLGRNCSQKCQTQAMIAASRKITTNEVTHPSWKGDKVGYFGVHDWITKHFGQPIGCEICGLSDSNPRRYNWANLSHTYKRDRNDFKRMCISCHRKYDGSGKKAWATFLKNRSKTVSTT